VLGCLCYYLWYRRRQKLPIGTIKRNWEKEQEEVLTSAEEFEMLAQYKEALAKRDKEAKRA